MRILIIGAGLAGLTAALYLSEKHDITVVDTNAVYIAEEPTGAALWTQNPTDTIDKIVIQKEILMQDRFAQFIKNLKPQDARQYLALSKQEFIKTVKQYPRLNGVYVNKAVFENGQLSLADGYFEIAALRLALQKTLRERGVQFIPQTTVDPLRTPGVVSVNKCERQWDRVVVAAGHQSYNLLRHMWSDIGNVTFPVRGYTVTGSIGGVIRLPGVIHDSTTTACPNGPRTTVSGGYELSDRPNAKMVEQIFRQSEIAHWVLRAPDLTIRSGVRNMTCTGLPIVQKINHKTFVITGFGNNGFTFCWKAARDMFYLIC